MANSTDNVDYRLADVGPAVARATGLLTEAREIIMAGPNGATEGEVALLTLNTTLVRIVSNLKEIVTELAARNDPLAAEKAEAMPPADHDPSDPDCQCSFCYARDNRLDEMAEAAQEMDWWIRHTRRHAEE